MILDIISEKKGGGQAKGLQRWVRVFFSYTKFNIFSSQHCAAVINFTVTFNGPNIK